MSGGNRSSWTWISRETFKENICTNLAGFTWIITVRWLLLNRWVVCSYWQRLKKEIRSTLFTFSSHSFRTPPALTCCLCSYVTWSCKTAARSLSASPACSSTSAWGRGSCKHVTRLIIVFLEAIYVCILISTYADVAAVQKVQHGCGPASCCERRNARRIYFCQSSPWVLLLHWQPLTKAALCHLSW